MSEKQTHAVTGAYGYSGKYIAHRLLDKGCRVITLTNSIHRNNPFGDRVRAYPFNFDNPNKLTQSLNGVRVLYNTYWVRFNYKLFTLVDALKNSLTLFNAAKEAGVRKIVHISITNPSEDSHVQTIGKIIGRRRPIISAPPALVYIAGRIISQVVNDVLITREEIEGIMSNLLCVNSPPTGKTRLTGWIEEHAESLGKRYTSELARRIDRETEYKSN
jgi:NAD(P)-dependent dehydrogenase (short-subunit alcohol dehydrogenase family)